jgi:hypothetical protein
MPAAALTLQGANAVAPLAVAALAVLAFAVATGAVAALFRGVAAGLPARRVVGWATQVFADTVVAGFPLGAVGVGAAGGAGAGPGAVVLTVRAGAAQGLRVAVPRTAGVPGANGAGAGAAAPAGGAAARGARVLPGEANQPAERCASESAEHSTA